MTARGRTHTLRRLVEDGMYAVDPGAVAHAMAVRHAARALQPDLTFRSDEPRSRLRSFRADPHARSFRLTGRR
ncbi:hypothetical protein NBH00_20830 [Paraconexibacter antarcticus]|uniref:Uncharacterized protein n=1 Tax=Paraconexibacter antarcticus TaxID=2949664 RepID=A0ABY5DQ33_9ACTN|nr:hypothetical protein [Paraconexibacter antarcticus]UTI63776.1 hypothetical protein NBH00_20830 [Paraconexibacter antarcticus]